MRWPKRPSAGAGRLRDDWRQVAQQLTVAGSSVATLLASRRRGGAARARDAVRPARGRSGPSSAARRRCVRPGSVAAGTTEDAALEGAPWRQWADKLGIHAEKVDLRMLRDTFGAELRGMCAVGSIGSDEPLIRVPAGSALQVTTGGACPLGSAVSAESWRVLPWWAQLAVLLVYEVQRGGESPLAAWVGSLPRDFPAMPLNWTDSELAALEYPPMLESVAAQRLELAETFAAAARGCAFPLREEDFRWAVQVVRSRAFSGPYEGRGAGDRLAQMALIASLFAAGVASGTLALENALNGAFVTALSIPLTDFFVGSSAKLKRHVVCPVVDYLNHDSKAASDIAYEYFGDEFAVRVRGGFQVGEQACINYGEERSNDALLQYYGFVERDCPHDTYELDLLRHLDAEASAAGSALPAKLSRTGPDALAMAKLRRLLADDAGWHRVASPEQADDEGPLSEANEGLAWRAVSLACEAELRQLSSGAAHEAAAGAPGAAGAAARFRTEKEKVLLACRAHAEARCSRPASAAPLSLATRSAVLPYFEEAGVWRHAWASAALHAEHGAQLRDSGFCIVPNAFDAGLATRCLAECNALDAGVAATVTTNRCNRGSRSLWLEFGLPADREALRRELPALCELAEMLAGLPCRADEIATLGGGPALRVHPAVMVAVYPERAAEYALHKDSYAPKDNNPATGATRRLTALAYLNDWREGDGGELRLHEAAGDLPDPRRSRAVAPSAGCLVLFDSRRVWHAVAPSMRGPRWAVTLWVH